MSNKELDSLFKNKLENLERQPGADAWNKIQVQTQKKKAGAWLWMRVAAAILLLLVSGIVIWNASQDTMTANETVATSESKSENTATDIQPESTLKDEVENIDTPQQDIPRVDNTQKVIPLKKSQEANRAPKILENDNPVANNEATNVPLPTIDEIIEESGAETLIAENETADATHETENTSTTQEATGTTLVFNIEDFQKTQVAANATNEANTDEASEPKKGLNKVLNLMKELKSDAGIGDLREAKNDIFAFNFKKDSDDDSE